MRKMMRKILMGILSGVFLLCLAAPGFSENQAGTFTVDPFLGFYQFDSRQKLDSFRGYYGLRVGYNITKYWGLEGMFGYVPTETFSMLVDKRDVHVFRYGINALFNFNPDGRWVPYLTLGFGGFSTYTRTGARRYHRLLIDYGVGLKYFISEIVALRAEFKQPTFFDGAGYKWRDLRTNREYTLGLSFLIGGKTTVCEEEKKAVAKVVAPVVLVVLGDNHFEFDKSTITPQGADILDVNIKILKANPKVRVRIAGYTSAMGTQEYNQNLSEKRAVSVRDYLIKGGIAPRRITTIGYGEMRPAEYEPLPDKIYSKEAKANMRVLFEVIAK
jgi:OOP family OmpA-OmpF porin